MLTSCGGRSGPPQRSLRRRCEAGQGRPTAHATPECECSSVVANRSLDQVDGLDWILVLPETEHRPAELVQAFIGLAVTLLIALGLRHPPLAVGRGRRRVDRA